MDIQETVNEIVVNDLKESTYWLWFAICEFLIILILIIIVIKLYRKLKDNQNLAFSDVDKNEFKKRMKHSSVDMDGLMNSINNSKSLYKKLSRVCHPDRFVNTNKHKKSEEIFQELSNSKRDFKKLEALKERAKKELNIKLK